ncbi:tetratricopeptide repeat protein [Polaribacter marinivivus]|uniref:Tetratricopeptide repeat protein n=1 Tax=Polaribacter marinivivus TaxID=1524260 RepID=A0ABV8R7L3_9FLAO
MKKILILLLLIANVLNAQDEQKIFESANEMYRQQNYEKAIEYYKFLEKYNLISSELFYNLGNSYYKLNKVGPSIYYYEKALKLNPLNKDVQNNLVFARRLALDNIEELPKTVFQKLNSRYLQKLSYNQWAIVSIVFCVLGSLLFLLFYFSNQPRSKRTFFITSLISFLFLIISLTITYNQFSYFKNNKVAIVFAEETEVRNAPSLNSEEVFTLHEGTKVIVLDTIDDWKKIKIADGKIGWIIANDIQLLDNF